jgi:hypothetical protein
MASAFSSGFERPSQPPPTAGGPDPTWRRTARNQRRFALLGKDEGRDGVFLLHFDPATPMKNGSIGNGAAAARGGKR